MEEIWKIICQKHIQNKNRTLKTDDLQELGIKDNELLHTEASEKSKNGIEHFSKEDMGIIKIRAMMYPYVIMYKNRNDEKQLEVTFGEIERDAQMIEQIYGKDFLETIRDIDFLKKVQSDVKQYNNVLEFAEGMSKELLGIEQTKGVQEVSKDDKEESKYLITPSTIEHDTQEVGLKEINQVIQETKDRRKSKMESKGQEFYK